jgi:ADP-ribose pyrophosphatase
VKTKTLCAGKYLRLALFDGYEAVERINCTGVAVIAPITDKNEIVLVEQYRRAIDARMIELPAGLVGDPGSLKDESMEDAARRELLEETGYEAETLELIGRWPTSGGMSSEIATVFLARGLKRVGSGGGDDTENIVVHVVPLATAGDWLREMEKKGFFLDPKIFSALYFATRPAAPRGNRR